MEVPVRTSFPFACCLLLTGVHAASIPAQGGTSGIVISQLYGGGGNSGATLRNDFIELFNSGNQAVTVTGWSVQYAAATGVSWNPTVLDGVIQPGQYYLIQEHAEGGGTVSLPTPDVSDNTNLSATDGKIALVSNATALSGASPTGSQIIDFVGYGAANAAEGSPVPALDNTTAAIRLSGGCTDTNNNRADFVLGPPVPRNSHSPVNLCSTAPLTPVFSILKTHTGNFTQGQNGASYTIMVANSGTASTNGQVTVTENTPNGLSAVSMSGRSWNCPPLGTTCTRSDTLNPGASYSTITVAVNVASNAPASVNNQATVAGGGASQQSASDLTTITPSGAPAPSIAAGGVVPVGSTVATIQPGEWVSIYGTSLASSTVTWNGNFPTSLGGTSVTINGKSAYLSFVSPGQINLQAPNDTGTGTVLVVVTNASGSASSTVTLAEFGPSFLLLDNKHVAGIIIRANGSGAYGGGTYDIVGPTGTSLGYSTVAARAGDTIELFGTGFGPTNPAVPSGQGFSGAAPTTNAVTLYINGVAATPAFAGLSGAGLYQLNLTVPSGVGTGDVSLVATVGGVQTPPTVVISLQ
jgi:uncharacterized protein (TIGR03437 family)